MREDLTPIHTLAAFRDRKRQGMGVIAIRGLGTKVHAPQCPHARGDAFLQKLENRGGGYFWAPSPEAVLRRWPGARRCRHPSDPPAGGIGGPEAQGRLASRAVERDADEWAVRGPGPGERCVRADADGCLPFEVREPWQAELRAELRDRLRRLTAGDDEILHASFFGRMPPRADVENLLLLDVDQDGASFVAAAEGIRFERSPVPMPRADRAVTMLYRPVPRDGRFAFWEPERVLAVWDGIPVGDPRERLEVWWALARTRAPGDVEHHDAFAIRASLTVPADLPVTAPSMVKPVLDGAVAAAQAHTDHSTLDAVARRVAAALGERPDDVGDRLAETSGAVLGPQRRLVHLRGPGVQMAPGDERLVAAEVLVQRDPAADDDLLTVEIAAVRPRRAA